MMGGGHAADAPVEEADASQPTVPAAGAADAPQSRDASSLISYAKASSYWRRVPASLTGMLGGLGHVSHVDIKSSGDLLTAMWKWKRPPGGRRALDCGSGIGRVTRQLLSRRFDMVDTVEQCAKFVEAAHEALRDNPHVGQITCAGLQEFDPPADTYDVVWCQWVLGHLTDGDLERFFVRCRKSLRDDGVIVVKENLTSNDESEYDATDSSVTRPRPLLEAIFARADLRVVATRRQHGMPRGLYAVMMFVLRPEGS